MIGNQDILTLALQLGGAAAQTQTQSLGTLCRAAKAAVEKQLPMIPAEAEDTAKAAMAYLALSWLPQTDAQHFTAGDVSVSRGSAQSRASYYAALAQQLLAPYVGATDFAFLGVEA